MNLVTTYLLCTIYSNMTNIIHFKCTNIFLRKYLIFIAVYFTQTLFLFNKKAVWYKKSKEKIISKSYNNLLPISSSSTKITKNICYFTRINKEKLCTNNFFWIVNVKKMIYEVTKNK